MMYQYVAYDKNGVIVRGKVNATGVKAVNEVLENDGYRVTSVKGVKSLFNTDLLMKHFSQIKKSEIVFLFRQLALLLDSGISIVTALEILKQQSSNRLLNKVLEEVLFDVRNGGQLSNSLARHADIFPPVYCRSLSVGEQTGGLENMLRQISEYMEKEEASTKKIKGALTYPVLTIIVAFVVIGILITFVLPSFTNLYSSLGAELPFLTRMLLAVGNNAKNFMPYVVLFLGVFIGAAYVYIRTPDGKYNWHKYILKIPLIGKVVHLNELSRCCRNISLLYHAGLPMTEIMNLVAEGIGNRFVSHGIIQVQQELLKGEGLSRPMSRNSLFLPMMVQMVKVGEETGNLDTTLNSVSQNYEAEAQEKTAAMIGYIQPAMTIGLGLIVGLVTLSLVSAMYSIYGAM